MAKKYYVVRKGYKTGIFVDWEECKSYVCGFSGAEYKSFNNQADAYDYLNNKTEYINTENPATIDNDKAIAYCDGSYDNNTQKFAYGVVIMYDRQTIEFSQAFDAFDTGRNVTGEIFGAMKAMQYCLDNDIKSLDLYYDYAGIEAWATGAWKANKELTKRYALFANSLRPKLNIKFIKVQAHTGIEFNERADKLAKAALGL